MKKNYMNLEYEVVCFDEEDIITASGKPCDCDDVKVLTPVCPPNEVVCPRIEYCPCISVEK